MNDALAVIGPINTAIRLKKVVAESRGCNPMVIHTPSVISDGGCSYSLKFSEQHIPIILAFSDKLNISIKNIYIESTLKGVKEYYVIS